MRKSEHRYFWVKVFSPSKKVKASFGMHFYLQRSCEFSHFSAKEEWPVFQYTASTHREPAALIANFPSVLQPEETKPEQQREHPGRKVWRHTHSSCRLACGRTREHSLLSCCFPASQHYLANS